MASNMKSTVRLLRVAFLLMLSAGSIYAQSPRRATDSNGERLQRTPTDSVLRERIIKLAQELRPGPALLEGAIATRS